MQGPIPYQRSRLVPDKLYVCELGSLAAPPPNQLRDRRLAGPFDVEVEAHAAAGAIEAEHPYYQARTEVWRSDVAETDAFPTDLAFPVIVSLMPQL